MTYPYFLFKQPKYLIISIKVFTSLNILQHKRKELYLQILYQKKIALSKFYT